MSNVLTILYNLPWHWLIVALILLLKLPQNWLDLAWDLLKRFVQLLVVIATLGFAGVYLYQLVLFGSYSRDLTNTLLEHIPVAIGIPLATIAATCIVVVLEFSASDTIKFEVLGLRFEGASGQIILWGFCFLAFVSAVKLLW
ncbi:hypothetical protein PCC7424_3685 [Gloeothece citriformis PCC 7424]|uniref:Uncharacterized protein n=1 Tax=Gloeothece citriformis (strain PCC 7424) TaxID=65393 RepID=B7KHW9_GLOC7|nr:hypothetical protein [Gloeothece citriformis]ACK72066.1 hypothetical protein PCC7424_3685 [Gloeothece citriformis PCC 7424]